VASGCDREFFCVEFGTGEQTGESLQRFRRGAWQHLGRCRSAEIRRNGAVGIEGNEPPEVSALSDSGTDDNRQFCEIDSGGGLCHGVLLRRRSDNSDRYVGGKV
jgi:hypothetical protein